MKPLLRCARSVTRLLTTPCWRGVDAGDQRRVRGMRHAGKHRLAGRARDAGRGERADVGQIDGGVVEMKGGEPSIEIRMYLAVARCPALRLDRRHDGHEERNGDGQRGPSLATVPLVDLGPVRQPPRSVVRTANRYRRRSRASKFRAPYAPIRRRGVADRAVRR